MPIRQFLPYSYLQPDEDARRFLRLSRRHLDDVMAGRMTRTLRWQEPVSPGPVMFVFEDGEHLGFDTMPGVIDSVTPIHLADVDSEYQEELRRQYPGIPSDARIDEVRFHI